MKPTNTTLNNVLNSQNFILVNAYIFTLLDGTILRYCDGDKDITYNNNVYSAGGINTGAIFNDGNKISLSWKRGLDVDTLEFSVIPRDALIEGTPFLSALKNGIFDGADLTLGRFYMPTYGDTSAGLTIVFKGRVGQIVAGRVKAIFTINSYTELLNMQLPRNLYQPPCLNTLFDNACRLSKNSYAVNGTIVSGSTQIILKSSLNYGSGYFTQGIIKFTSGVNYGYQRSVKTFTSGNPSTISLYIPLGLAPVAGDTFTIYPGCDKTKNTCSSKFNNLANFRGLPFIPENSTAI